MRPDEKSLSLARYLIADWPLTMQGMDEIQLAYSIMAWAELADDGT